MGNHTAQDFCTQLRHRLGGVSTDELTDQVFLDYCVNPALVELYSTHHEWLDEAETTVDVTVSSGSTTKATTVTGVVKVRNVRDTTSDRRVSECDRDELARSTTRTGSYVSKWMWAGKSGGYRVIEVRPEPTQDVTLRFWYIPEPTELVLTPTATSTVLDAKWDGPILDLAETKARKLMGELDKAKAAHGEASSGEGRAKGSIPNASSRVWPIAAPIAPATGPR